MATFKICVFEHQKRKDNKYPVSIRVYWNKKSAYIKTEYYVVIEQVNQNKRKKIFELKDTVIINELTNRIGLFEKAKIDILGLSIYNYSASELARYFEDLIYNKDDKSIDFIKFARSYIENEKAKGKNVLRLNASINALTDFAGDTLNINDLTSKYLGSFVSFLGTTRRITRVDQFGRKYTSTNKPISDTTIRGYTTDIRTIFNRALNEFNDEEKGVTNIHHYPFKKFKIIRALKSKNRTITERELYRIFRIPESFLHLSRAILARDTFMLSFLLVGMNHKDFYLLKKKDYKNGRITYKRAKTKDRRSDEALISIKVEKEALPYIGKYLDDTNSEYLFTFHKRYSTPETFVSNMTFGLKRVAECAGVSSDLSTYYARHTWATIARNKCKISKSDVDECLNHVNKNEELADVYIEKDWSVIDDANRKVLDHIFIYSNLRKDFVKRITANKTKSVRLCGDKKSDLLL